MVLADYWLQSPQGTFSASGGQPQTHERHTAEVVGNCEYWEGARPARKSSRRTNHKGRTVQRVGGGVTNGGGTVRAVGGIEPGSDPWLVANPTTLPRGHTYIHVLSCCPTASLIPPQSIDQCHCSHHSAAFDLKPTSGQVDSRPQTARADN